ncbi:MAG TPA: polyprenol monophosphomannose synthase [Acidimicrobiales bacterium]|nr:polyprenol monophosphomannose synthase [Acidimicrobiales bacterium]
MRVLVVLPTYNESATIGRILEAVRSSLPDADVLVVDDSSPDGTAKLVEEAAGELGQVHLLSRAVKNGLGPAYRAGFAWGLERGYEAFVEMDSDFSHDPAALPQLVAPLERGYDVAIGSRYIPGGHIPNWKLSRRMLSRGGNVYADLLLGLRVHDSTAGYRVYSAAALQAIDLDTVHAGGYGFQIEMTYRAKQAGARIIEVPISFVDRVEGVSKMSRSVVTEAMWLVTRWGGERLLDRLLGRTAPRRLPATGVGTASRSPAGRTQA